MPIPDNFLNDIYRGLKSDVRQHPWMALSVGLLWTTAWVVVIFVYPTLAHTADVQKTDSKVDIVLRVVLEQQLKDMVRVQCDSPDSSWWPVENRIKDQQKEYESMTNRKWHKMSCLEARK